MSCSFQRLRRKVNIAYDLVSPWTYLELVPYSVWKQCTWAEYELYWCLYLTDQNIDQVKCHRPSNTKLSKTLMKRCVAIQCFPLKICYHNEKWQHSASPWVSSCLLRVAKVVTPKFIRSIEYLEVSYSIYTVIHF